MRIGIDISQLAHGGTGVANYTKQLVEHLLKTDKENEYVLFYSSMRKPLQNLRLRSQMNVSIKTFRYPPTFLDFLWNKLHIVPIERFIGDVDVFISSDWVQPPSKAKKITILYDLIVYKYPEETARQIVEVQKRRLRWVKKECAAVICISEATKYDAREVLAIPENKLFVCYPGVRS